jgi:cell division protein FtsB
MISLDQSAMPPTNTSQSAEKKDSRKTVERNATLVTAIFGAVTAFLVAVTAYFGVTKADVVQQRDNVQSNVSTLATQQSTLRERVARLTSENADLRQQLEAAASDSGATTDTATDVVVRPLTVPLPDDGSSIGLFLDKGRIANTYGPDLRYERQESTGRPQLVASDGLPYSTDVDSVAVSRESCRRAATASPSIRPIRPLRSGLLICVLTDGGTSRLLISAPQKDGTLKISQKFWAKP